MSPRCPPQPYEEELGWSEAELVFFLAGWGCKTNKPYMGRVERFSAATLFVKCSKLTPTHVQFFCFHNFSSACSLQ